MALDKSSVSNYSDSHLLDGIFSVRLHMRSGGHRPFVQPARESAGEAFFIGANMDESRFWSKVDKTSSCWNWKAYTDRYGIFRVNRKLLKAHRVSWVLFNGPIPDGLCVLHRCDNTKCVNPGHLFLGSQLDNVLDMERKGRSIHPKGEGIGTSRLTKEQVIEIRSSNESLLTLGLRYGVSKQAIYKINHMLTWRHI